MYQLSRTTPTMFSVLIFLELIFIFAAPSSATCPSNPPSNLTNAGIPILVEGSSGFLTQDSLTLVFESPFVDGREESSFSFFDFASSGEGACIVTWNWVNDTTNCVERYTAAIPWSILSGSCGLTKTSNSDQYVFTGTVTVKQTDNLGTIRSSPITRDTYSPFTFTVTFPRDVEVNSTDPMIYSPINTLAAIVNQHFDAVTQMATIQLYTSVQYPFLLTNPTITVDTVGLNVFVAEGTVVSCPPSGPGACNVIYNIYVNSSNLCFLNGTYTVNFDVACEAGIAPQDCPLQTNSAQIIFSTASNDFCGQFGNVIDISATLHSYVASDHAVQRDAYLIDQTMYFQVQTTSSKVSLESTYFLNCSSIWKGVSTLVYSSTVSPVPAGTTIGFTLDGTSASTASFSAVASPNLYDLSADSSSMLIMDCWIGVDYSYVTPTVKKRSSAVLKRSFSSSGSSQSQVAATVSLQALSDLPSTVENSASSLGGFAVVAVVSLVLSVLF